MMCIYHLIMPIEVMNYTISFGSLIHSSRAFQIYQRMRGHRKVLGIMAIVILKILKYHMVLPKDIAYTL